MRDLSSPSRPFHMPLQIAVQVALVVAKVARVDYPRAWSTLFSDLLAKLRSQNALLIRSASSC